MKNYNNFPKWGKLLKSYKVPLSMITNNLYKKKEKVIKGKKKFIPIKPKKPSKRIEVLFQAELKIIKDDEGCFTEFKELVKSLAGGVSLDDVNKVTKELISLTTQKWQVVQKWSAPLTTRIKILLTIGKKINNKLTKLSKNNIQSILTELTDNVGLMTFDEGLKLSSYNILVISQRFDSKYLGAFKNLILNKSLYANLRVLEGDEPLLLILNENIGTFGFPLDFEKIRRKGESMSNKDSPREEEDLNEDNN